MTRRTLVALALLFAGCVAEDFFWTGPRTDAYDFEGLPAERLEERELEAPTGERVAALWIAPPDPAAPVVLFLHGAGTNLERSVPRLEALVALEVGVFAIDYRGFGRSEGDASERRSYEDGDLAWATLVGELAVPPERVVVYGHSMGGAVATHVAQGRAPRALIVESSVASGAAAVESVAWVTDEPGLVLEGEWDSEARIATLGPFPKAILHGTEDRTFPAWNGERLAEAASAPVTLHLFEGGSHTNLPLETNAAWREAFCCAAMDPAEAESRCETRCP
ncbi:MAG TPA: alpha/beta fold hydrolase [Polyangiaceae bacterium LLY-WYZ-15_(1-7)]|nr:alpha/beta fold hydrolase [Polyangiaceae bacterium LLY-WYZ-15_(1-7)]HJL02295.1 alpha/beta fold hydrolase [Polyangiaceae bacterium LLY-WYZ-15_(1-7)]HJL12880.1 alpha/beta fold hydrolase [Polyangiaceae bacterium LLY-WYZ-15_(1-7)]HJL23155.1 alpha/beta fold hydrolase [Polyangiaceae bacterium LLY-WYZ-15_(1-7)]HJL34688.1 alpha/beta fold hydrolase [Polyangiaceae bacterium LLY-WYZ-15_(1-7)]